MSALCPGLVDTGISRSRRNRPAALDTPQSDGGAFVEQALVDGTAGSMSPAAVADLVVEAIREEHFLVPTRPSYAEQLTDRTDDLVAEAAAPQPHLRLIPRELITRAQHARQRPSCSTPDRRCSSTSAIA